MDPETRASYRPNDDEGYQEVTNFFIVYEFSAVL